MHHTVRPCAIVLTALFLVSLSANIARAAAGDPDTTFNGTGKVITTVGTHTDQINSVAVQPDGKIVAAGSAALPNRDILVLRYNPNGTLDGTFNTTGIVTTPIGTGDDIGVAVALQSDGKIVVAGSTFTGGTYDFAVLRYNSNGSLDTSFNGTGIVITPIGSFDDFANGMVLQADGKIVVAGASANNAGGTSNYFAVVRYNSNGTLDTTFNGTGKVTTSVGSTDYANEVAIQPDGKIVVVGETITSNRHFAMVRYNINGSLDTAFNGTGKVITILGSVDDQALTVAIQVDARILVGGITYDSGSSINKFALVRYNVNGSLDTSFNGTGVVTTSISSQNDDLTAIAIQPNSRIVAVGYNTSPGATFNYIVARYNSNGAVDGTFNQTSSIDLNNTNVANAVALQADGRILAGGTAKGPGGDVDCALLRYLGDATVAAGAHPHSDFDGDYRSDIATWNPSTGSWNIRNSHTNFNAVPVSWGAASLGDIPVPGDYDGDGRTDIAVWRASEGNWYILNQPTRGWGGMGDKPVPADYDGDGKTDFAVWRPSDGNWYIINSATNTVTVRSWGASTDVPVLGDFDGDGKSDIAVYRPSEGNWYIINSSTNTLTLRAWGATGDKLVPADYDGDGKTDIAVFRPAEGNWYIVQSSTNTLALRNWGGSGDILVPADYDQDGKADIAIYRPSEGNWYIIYSSNGAGSRINFGSPTEVPVPSMYLPQ